MELVKPEPASKLIADSRRSKPLKVAVMSGKGGAGKSTFAANLAARVASSRPGVILLDCDLNVGQLHLLLGLSPCFGLAQVVRGDKNLKQVIEAHNGLHVVPGGPNGGQGLEVERSHIKKLLNEAETAIPSPAIVIVDTGPSRIATAPDFAAAADIALAVTTPEPTSVRSTVALLEALCCNHPGLRPWVLVNMASGEGEATATYDLIRGSLLPLFEDNPYFFGCVPFDPVVPLSVRQAVPFVVSSPESPASRNLAALAESLMREGAGQIVSGAHTTRSEDERSARQEGQGRSGRGPSSSEQEASDGEGEAGDGEDGDEAMAA
jgi:flagellar biosynthesis protein FlhG